QFTMRPIAMRAEPFPMTQVRLLPNNVYHDHQEWNRGYMTRLDPDRMLYTFRERRSPDRQRQTAWRVGTAGEQRPVQRTAWPLPRRFPLGERATLRIDRRQGRQVAGGLHGRRDVKVPGETRRQLPERVPDDVVRPSREARASVGT